MHWSFWIAPKWRGISIFFICIVLFVGLLLARFLLEGKHHTQLQFAQTAWQQAIHQQKIAQQQYDLWDEKKTWIQQGLHYRVAANTPVLPEQVKDWQASCPHRKLRFELEEVEAPSSWHDKATQAVHRLQLRFWVQDEDDLSRAWLEKKRLPCLMIIQSAQLSLAEEGGIWVEEDIVCVQF